MSIRAFRRLSRAERRAYISRVQDPLTLRVLEIAFLGAGKVSWAKVACMIGGDNMELGRQQAIIKQLELPCAALVCSGGKSVHAIVLVEELS